MKFEEYSSYFESILAHPEQFEVYQDEEYLAYTKLNWSRMNRWMKKLIIEKEVINLIDNFNSKQHWILITEPWCGDAAHAIPVIYKMIKDNPNIDLDIQLRDEDPFLIDQYLTNGGKSIPKLIIRDDSNLDIAVWGPRPSDCADLFERMKANGSEFDEIKEEIQKWYNQDKGIAIQKEIAKLLF